MDNGKIMDIYGKVCINSFAIDNIYNEPIGKGLYIGQSHSPGWSKVQRGTAKYILNRASFSVLDHSCDPDLSFNFDGPKAFLTNLKPLDQIKNTPLKKLKISYLEPGLMKKERQEKLQGNYYFECKCNFCNNDYRESQMKALVCTKPDCHGTALLSKNDFATCETCQTVQPDVTKALDLLEQRSKMLESVEFFMNSKDYESAYSKCQKFLQEIRRFFHPISRLRAEFAVKCSGLSKALFNFKQAQELCEEALQSNRLFIPLGSATWIVDYLEMAKTCIAAGDKANSSKYAKMALSLCDDIHGKRNQLYDEVKSL